MRGEVGRRTPNKLNRIRNPSNAPFAQRKGARASEALRAGDAHRGGTRPNIRTSIDPNHTQSSADDPQGMC